VFRIAKINSTKMPRLPRGHFYLQLARDENPGANLKIGQNLLAQDLRLREIKAPASLPLSE
jgi:hypothetical protein